MEFPYCTALFSVKKRVGLKELLQQRNPMLLLEFVGPLFKFNANRPALAPLFQLPERRAGPRQPSINPAQSKDRTIKQSNIFNLLDSP